MLVFLAVAIVLICGRLTAGRGDVSYFIVAGTDFVDPGKTLSPVAVQQGQGYDGQFFYKYALDPLDFSADGHGVHTDHPAYRMQRIAYPLMAWLLSLGGMPAAVPWALVLINMLAFLGIGFYMVRMVVHFGGSVMQGLYPLLLCGVYMSMARDLAEVSELFFFTASLYYLLIRRYPLFCVFATLTILSRETSIIAYIPLAGWFVLQAGRKRISPASLVFVAIPFLVFACWKAYIYVRIPSVADAAAGYGSLGVPFKGIVMGLKENLDLTSAKNVMQLMFWVLYLGWQVMFVIIVLRSTSFRGLLAPGGINVLKVIYLCWLLFAICFSATIYCDDWGFVRIFSLWNMVGFLLIIAERKTLGRSFTGYSAGLAALTIIRLIIRV